MNQGSIRLRRCASSTLIPRRSAWASSNMRSGPLSAMRRPSSSTSPATSSGSGRSKPARPVSSERIALPSDSRKVRPIAITSPTDFIWVPRMRRVWGNFSKLKRGIFTTT